MIERIIVDENLLYLEKVLLNLLDYTFDDDVRKHINNLYALVSKKLYSKLKSDNDIDYFECEIIFYYKK